MTRLEAVLAVLASAEGQSYQPVQIQKALFLVDQNLLKKNGFERFGFEPYDYGPFDATVYSCSERLASLGQAEVVSSGGGRWKAYRATEKGVADGKAILARLSEPDRNYVKEVSSWVRSLGFSSLVKSIYSAYPEMRANSIFSG
jgi:uncharacterized protein